MARAPYKTFSNFRLTNIYFLEEIVSRLDRTHGVGLRNYCHFQHMTGVKRFLKDCGCLDDSFQIDRFHNIVRLHNTNSFQVELSSTLLALLPISAAKFHMYTYR